ncbi:uncharacterized protein LOC131842229 [Achroia grisella]|uniref:uncharacterized protein LOC131842229 n=1 Tax=Achroia grisella TaxID=688607 RepID=UPI0027D23D25|nr:uncharacterized protein LOC131842229 [Achroia grisella]
MASLRLEGDVNSLSVRQQQFLRDVLDKRGFKNNKVVIKPLGKAGDNYVANVKQIIVEKENGESLKIVAKVAPTIEFIRLTMSTANVFENERLIYEVLLPKFSKLQKDAGVPKEYQYQYAECYGALSDTLHEMILLEDLNVKGYAMLDRLNFLTDDIVKTVLKNLAIYHSISFVIKQAEPAYYEDLKLKFFNNWSHAIKQPPFQNHYTTMIKDTITILNNDKYASVIKNILSKMQEHDADLKNKDVNTVIHHGDAWTNNLLFKSLNGKPTECILIDYQIATAVSPVYDLLFMIFNCTDYATRREHYQDWINYYHSELDKSLSFFGLRAESLYPIDQLNSDLKTHSGFQLGLIILFASFSVRSSDEAAEMKDKMQTSDGDTETDLMQISRMETKSRSLYVNKITSTIDSYYELGYL